MHYFTNLCPAPADVDANIKRLTALGLEGKQKNELGYSFFCSVHITEMDVRFAGNGTEDELLAQQATVYGNILSVCLANPGCKSFETWGFTDKYSWVVCKSNWYQ